MEKGIWPSIKVRAFSLPRRYQINTIALALFWHFFLLFLYPINPKIRLPRLLFVPIRNQTETIQCKIFDFLRGHLPEA